MKILKFEASNVKRLRAVEIEPDGSLVQITGANGAGKTSVLDSIWWALAGSRSHQDEPIRRGRQTARVRLDLGDVVVTRHFRRSTSKQAKARHTTRVVVESAEGAVYRSPQAMLDALVGPLSFDPLSFLRSGRRRQADVLARHAGIDLDKRARLDRADAAERRRLRRDARSNRSAADLIAVPDGTPDEAPDTVALSTELEEALGANREREEALRQRSRTRDRVADLEAEAARLFSAAARLREEADGKDRRAVQKQESAETMLRDLQAADPVPAERDLAPIRARIAAADSVSAAVRARRRRADLRESAAELEARAEAVDAELRQRAAEAEEQLESAGMPVDGLAIADGAVTLDGLPLDQASDARQLEVACALAMADNADLQVVRVRDGSLLDSESLAALERMASERGWQVWIERVDESGSVGWVIEDGTLASSPASRANEEGADHGDR